MTEVMEKIEGVLKRFWEECKSPLKWLLLAAALVLLGFGLCWKLYVSPLRTELAEVRAQLAVYEHDAWPAEKVEVPVEASTNVAAAYVPKEQETYIDPVTHQTVTRTEQTDVEMNVGAPTVTMKYNGKSYEMPGISGETSKFEKGKLQSTVNTNATIDLTGVIDEAAKARAEAQQKHFAVGVYGSTEGVLGSVGYINKGTEVDAITKVTDPGGFWGVGVRRWF